MIRVITVSGEPKPGRELPYWLALKHRHGYAELSNKTPWWQFKKAARRRKGWVRAMRAYHANGQDSMQAYIR